MVRPNNKTNYLSCSQDTAFLLRIGFGTNRKCVTNVKLAAESEQFAA